MRDESTIVSIVRERQKAIRREADRRGIAMKAVSQDSGIPYPTLLTYFPADALKVPAQIPGSAIYALAEGRALPADLLSLLLPAGLAIVEVPEDLDLDGLAAASPIFSTPRTRRIIPIASAGLRLDRANTQPCLPRLSICRS